MSNLNNKLEMKIKRVREDMENMTRMAEDAFINNQLRIEYLEERLYTLEQSKI